MAASTLTPISQVQNTSVPGNADERTAYLLYYLLTHKDFVKLSELADQLYVSTQTLSAVIKRVEAMLEYYHIQIQRKPYYGIRAEGSEFDKRCCLIRNFSSDGETFRRTFRVDDVKLRRIFNTLMSTLPLHQVRLTEVSLQNLAIYVYLSLQRAEQGFGIEQMPDKEGEGESQPVTLFAVHVEDQMMCAETFRILAQEFIDLYQSRDKK